MPYLRSFWPPSCKGWGRDRMGIYDVIKLLDKSYLKLPSITMRHFVAVDRPTGR